MTTVEYKCLNCGHMMIRPKYAERRDEGHIVYKAESIWAQCCGKTMKRREIR